MSLVELQQRIARHPLIVAYRLDGEDLRVCCVCGDLYAGEASPEGGIDLAKGRLLLNPGRTVIDCETPQTLPVPLTDPQVQEDPAVLERLWAALEFARENPSMIVAGNTSKKAYEAWMERFNNLSEETSDG